MKISERDKKLLLILLIVAILFLPYFFFIQPSMDKMEEIDKEITELRSVKSQLDQWAVNAEYYKTEVERMAVEKETIFQKYPSGLSQEASILFIDQTEKTIPISLYQVSFGEDVAAQITSEADKEQIQAVEEATGDHTDMEVIADTTETTSLGGGLQGIATSSQFTFSAGYEEFKAFLDYIANYRERMVITELNADYSVEMQTVEGSFKLLQYAIAGETREPVKVMEPNRLQGTSNVFMQAAGNFGEADQAGEPADFFLMLSQPEAIMEAKIIGKSGDTSEKTYLVSDDNSEQEVTITFEGDAGTYTASYSIGKKAYEGDKITFTKEGAIYFEILSSPRVGSDDKVAAKVSVINKTDVNVNVRVLEDDKEKPRVNIMGKTGAVLVK